MKSYLILPPETKTPLPKNLSGQIDVRDPEALIEQFLKEFTREGDRVFDPFAGFGTALKIAQRLNRIPYGVEFDPERWEYGCSQLDLPGHLVQGDSRRLTEMSFPTFHFSISSPPFMGRNDREDPLSSYTREGKGYERYLHSLCEIYREVGNRMVDGGRIVILISNLKLRDGLTPLAWDVAREVSQVLSFQGEIVVIPEEGFAFGYDHYYCLIFTKTPSMERPSESSLSKRETRLAGNVSEVVDESCLDESESAKGNSDRLQN